MINRPDWLYEICANCGCTHGSHNASTYYSEFYQMEVPRDYCPGHEGRMDWDNGPGTTFKPSGDFTRDTRHLKHGVPFRKKEGKV